MARRRRWRGLFRVAAVLAVLPFLPGAAPARAAEPLALHLDWIPGGNHAPLYVALEKGWYAEAGIALTIEPGKGSNVAVQAVGFAKNPVGIADLGTTLVGIGQGVKAVAVMAIYENAPFMLYWLKSGGMTGIKDVAGRAIGNPPGDAARVMWPALAKANGLAPDAVKWVNIAPQAKLSALKSRAVDAITDNYNGHGLKVRELGDDMGYLSFREAGLNPHGHVVIVNAEVLTAKRDLIQRFVRVTQKAYAACVPDGKPCVAALLRANSGLQEAEHLDQWARTTELMGSDWARTKALGGFDPARMRADYALVETYFKLERAFDVTTAYTNDLLDPAVRLP